MAHFFRQVMMATAHSAPAQNCGDGPQIEICLNLGVMKAAHQLQQLALRWVKHGKQCKTSQNNTKTLNNSLSRAEVSQSC